MSSNNEMCYNTKINNFSLTKCTLQVYRSEEHTTSVHVYPFFSFVELLFRTQKCVCVAKMKQGQGFEELSPHVREDLKF